MRMFKCGGALAFAVLLCAAIAAAQSSRLTLEPYKFENSKKETVDAEFGKLKVPENRNDPKSRLISLSFVRFKSTAEKPGPPIVYLAGGPGGSGIASAKYARFPLFMEMRKFGDVIALDQRGAGSSEPALLCPGKLELALDVPLTEKALDEELIRVISACAAEWRSKGADIRGYNTVQSAEDLEDLRKALGVKKIRLWGISYGTHLGLEAIRLHPGSIDRAILAGIEAAEDTLKMPAASENLLNELSRRAAADPNFGKAVPDFKALVASVLEKLRKDPVTVTVKDPESGKETAITLGAFDVAHLTADAMGDSYAMSLFPALYLGMSKGRFDFLAPHLLQFRTQPVPSLMSIAMDCASGVNGSRLARIREEAKTAVLGQVNAPFPEICKALPGLDLGDGFRKLFNSKVKVLFISGTLDGRTPPGNAEAVIKGFPNSSHLVIEGAAHSDDLFLSTPKIAETMSDFFGGKELPKRILASTEKPFAFRKP